MKDNFCVFDIETKGLSARPESFVLGCVYGKDGRDKHHFTDREKMIKYLFTQQDYKYIFAHNAEFDLTILFDNIIKNLDNAALFVGSLLVSAKKDGKVFMNSLAILKTSVEALGRASGTYKLELNNKFKNYKEGKKIIVTKKDIKYCYRDCEIIYDYLCEMFAMTKTIKPTVASCAMQIFKKEHLIYNFDYNPYNEKFRESYYGGRVECFKFGKEDKCFKYDINSLYPYVCTIMKFPDFSKIRKGKKTTIDNFISYYLAAYEGTAHVRIRHKKNFVGVLPYRRKTEIIYPCGTFDAWYNFNELRKAMQSGLIEIEIVHEFYYSERIVFQELRDYMIRFYEKKNTTEGAEKVINKFLLNALTGKFAQREHGEKIYFEDIQKLLIYVKENNIPKEKYTTHHFSEERKDYILEIEGRKGNMKPKWLIPTISSYITSEARNVMIDFYLKYQDHLLYTDTDSLILSCPIDDKYIGDVLGKFKKEHDESIEIIGNKHYNTIAGGKKYSYIKGIHKKHVKKGNRYIYKRMIRTKEALRRIEMLAGSFVEVEKVLKNDYTKRKVHTFGRTTPLIITDEKELERRMGQGKRNSL